LAATVEIREKNGAGETPTTKTSRTIRFKNADDANIDLNNPIVRPGAGSVFSYAKCLRLYIGATAPTGSITNPRAYTDGSNGFGTGVTMMCGTRATYSNPGTLGASSMDPGVVSASNLFGYTSGSPLDMDANNAGPFVGNNTDIADYLYLQAAVASNASPGLTPTETLTCAFDET
jgi:hypothetical protein